jgi:MurNAc alpha-1-phosphate uridylyltransferase
VFWLDGKGRALQRLAAAFDPERMDSTLLLQRTVTAVGYEGSGDYLIDASGSPHRRGEREVAPFLFAGLQLLHRSAFAGISDRVFSLVRLFDRAEERGRLHAIVHDGEWYHIGTPQGLAAARERLSPQHVWR